MSKMIALVGLTAVVLSAAAQGAIQAQSVTYKNATPEQLAGIKKDATRHFGDDPDDPGPLATNLSTSVDPESVGKAMRKVGDWQLKVGQPYFDRIWTWSVLYSGFMSAGESLKEPAYTKAMQGVGEKFNWELRSHLPDADNLSLGQTYLELYMQTPKEKRNKAWIEPTQKELDALIATPYVAKPGKEIQWWWCDALFMGPPVWARMYAITGDHKYIDYLDAEWAKTAGKLYIPADHLYARDVSYLTRKEANGKPMYWTRGEGWVMGGLIRTLRYLPKDDPARKIYESQLREMAASLKKLQGKDGLWRSGLLDQENYDLPEISGSALILFGIAGGVRDGILDKKEYLPVINSTWAGLVRHIYADGRLGGIQQTGAEPAPFKPSASYTYGVGGFLLAGAEIRALNLR